MTGVVDQQVDRPPVSHELFSNAATDANDDKSRALMAASHPEPRSGFLDRRPPLARLRIAMTCRR